MLNRSSLTLDLPKNNSSLPTEESAQNEIINLDDFEAPHSNLKYYEVVPIEELKALADKSGISECKDLDFALPYLKKANNVLEIGGGYGRALDYALSHKLSAHFDVLEPAKQFYSELVYRYTPQIESKQFSILPSHIESFNADKQYDVVLWLWSQINELSSTEIEKSLLRLRSKLNNGGVVCIETFDFNASPSTLKYKTEQHYFVDMKYQTLMITILSCPLIEAVTKKAGFSRVQFIPYALAHGFKRVFMILQA